MYKRLFIWVEGDRDRRFFETIVHPLFSGIFDDIKTREYSQMQEKLLKSKIKECKNNNNDYIFVVDMDSHGKNDVSIAPGKKKLCKTQKKDAIKKNYPYVAREKIVLSVEEIEGWYLAGLDRESCKELKIKYLPSTDEITKEQFLSLMPSEFTSEIDFRIEILKRFNKSIAKRKNKSFKYFLNKCRDYGL